MNNPLTLLAQTAEPVKEGLSPVESFMASPLPMMVAFILMFYFLLIRPQQRQRKELEARVAGLKKGDKVITSSGIHGVVNHKGEKTISLKIAEGVFITVESASIATVSPSGSQKQEEEQKAEEKK